MVNENRKCQLLVTANVLSTTISPGQGAAWLRKLARIYSVGPEFSERIHQNLIWLNFSKPQASNSFVVRLIARTMQTKQKKVTSEK